MTATEEIRVGFAELRTSSEQLAADVARLDRSIQEGMSVQVTALAEVETLAKRVATINHALSSLRTAISVSIDSLDRLDPPPPTKGPAK